MLIVGFVLLIKGADVFVDGASNVAYNFKIPTVIVGLTIVAFGTSAPEAAVSITSSLSGNNALAVSNVIGSNLFNMMLIIGLCALLRELKIGRDVLNKDLPFLVVITAILSGFIIIGWSISRIEGILLLLLIIGYISYLVYSAKNTKEAGLDGIVCSPLEAGMVKEAVARGQNREEEIIRQANADAAAIMDKAAADIAMEKKKAINDAKDEISGMAMAIAEKVVARELTVADQSKLVDEFINELGDQV